MKHYVSGDKKLCWNNEFIRGRIIDVIPNRAEPENRKPSNLFNYSNKKTCSQTTIFLVYIRFII